MKKKYLLKGAIVLLLSVSLIISSLAATAETGETIKDTAEAEYISLGFNP